MALRYVTIEKQACEEQIIEKSRFIAYAAPVNSREEADEFIKEIRARHRDATHNVPAFVIGEKQQIQWGSDDGEPQGTSGAPIVQYLVNEGLTNIVVVVTRYFGGIKLGTGGLVRAYTGSAKLAVEAAGRREVKDRICLKLSLPYNLLASLQNREKDMAFDILSVEYGSQVEPVLGFEPEAEAEIMSMLSDLYSGKPVIKERQELVV